MSARTRILIIEDKAGFRMMYGDMLAGAGYEVLTAEDGLKGWEISKARKPDLVLLDLGLPKMDGFAVLSRIRGDVETRSIPVIINSIVSEEKEVRKAIQLGANDYTVKGLFTPVQILEKIKAQLA